MSTVTLEETIIGVFAINQKYKIIAEKNYPNDPSLIAEKLKMQKQGIITSQIKKVMDTLIEKKVKKIISSNKELLETISTSYDIETEYIENTLTSKFIRLNIENLAVKSGLIVNVSDFGRLSHSVLNKITKDDIKEKMSKREALLIPSVQLLSDLDKTLNSLSNRLREWYGIHFPEMSDKVSNHVDYAKMVLNMGKKASITIKNLQKINIGKNVAKKIIEAAEESIGADLVEIDIISIQNYAKILLDLYKYRKDPLLGQFLKTLVLGQLLPNLGEELRANELGGAFSPVHIAQLIIRTVTLGILGILTFTTGLAAGVVLPR